MINKEEIRKHFSYLNNGLIYFNHASIGPIPDFTVEVIKNYLNERSSKNIENIEKIFQTISETKELAAKFINSSPDRIAFVDNVSNAMNLLAQGLKWERGDEIILFDIEFPANVYPFLNLQKEGIVVKILKTQNGKINFEDIESAITPKTRLLSISHVQFLSGFRADLEKLGKLCKQNDIIFSVDAIQSFGVVNIDVKRMQIDFLATGIQKWFLGLEGLTLIHITNELQDKIEQKYVGWLSVQDAWNILNFNLELDESAHRYENGTLNFAGIFSLNSNLKFFLSIGIDEIEKSIIHNSKLLIQMLDKEGFEFFFRPSSDDEIAGIVTIKVDNPNEVIRKLKENKIYASIREGYLRFSPHFYNTEEEIFEVVSSLKKITREF